MGRRKRRCATLIDNVRAEVGREFLNDGPLITHLKLVPAQRVSHLNQMKEVVPKHFYSVSTPALKNVLGRTHSSKKNLVEIRIQHRCASDLQWCGALTQRLPNKLSE
jgi:hypothetical protein